MKVTMITNVGCGYCNAAKKIATSAEFSVWASQNGVTVTGTQYNSAAGTAALERFGIKGMLKVPLMLVSDDAGNKVTWFSYRPSIKVRTAANLIAALAAVCGGDCSPAAPAVRTQCPTCKGTGYVAVLLAGFLGLLCGCENLSGNYTVTEAAVVKDTVVVAPEKKTEVKIVRNAFFWPSKLGAGEIVFPSPKGATAGKVSLTGYESTGGAAEMVPLFDASGRFVGTAMGAGVKAAVAP